MKIKIAITTIAMIGVSLIANAQIDSDNNLQIGYKKKIYSVSSEPYKFEMIPFGLGGNTEFRNYYATGKYYFYVSDGAHGNGNKLGLLINHNGNIGIGTTNPSNYRLVIHGTSNTHSLLKFSNDGNNDKGLQIGNVNYNSNNAEIWNWENGYFRIGTNNNEHLRVSPNGNIGIGTTSPSEKLEIVDDNASLRIRSTNLANNSSLKLDWGINHGYHISYNPNSAVTYFDSKHNAISNTPYGDVLFRRNVDNVMKETFVIKGNSGHVGIGTVDPGAWRLAVHGNIRAKEIKVETGWSDFVFYDDYKLPTLEEVETHIKEKGHLKDIPSAKEVAANGIFLGEMDSKLLQKIEELTLYTIEQEKKIKVLEKQVQENKKQNSKIKELEVLVQELLKEKK